MATLEKIRTRAGVLVAVVIGLALIAFVLGDLVNSGGSLFNQSQMELAEINGNSIPFNLYQSKIEESENLQKMLSNQNSIDEQTSLRIREQVWQDMLRSNVMDPEYGKLGLEIHPDELLDMVQGKNIHPIISHQFADPQTGVLNRDYLASFLQNMDRDANMKFYWLFLEKEIVKDRAFTKYTNLVRKGLYATSLQAKRTLNDREHKVDFDYVVARLSTIPDSLVAISNSDLKSYYSRHKNDYRQDESRDVEYVVFQVEPLSDDVKAAEDYVLKAKEELVASEDPKQYVALNSDVQPNLKYLNKSEIPQEFQSWAFDAKVGDVEGPYTDGMAFKIARVVDIKMLPDSVKARHILIAPKMRGEAAKKIVKDRADSLMNVIKKGNADWNSLALRYSDDPGSKEKGGDLGWFGNGVMVAEFDKACFEGKKGDVQLIETNYGYHIIQVVDKSKETKKVQIAVLEREIVASSQTIQKKFVEASTFAAQCGSFEQFNNAVAEHKLTKHTANNLLQNDRNIAGLDSPRELIRWAFKTEKEKVSTIFEFGSKYVVAIVTVARKEGVAPIEQVAHDVKARVMREKKLQMLKEKVSEAMAGGASLNDIAQKLNTGVEKAEKVSFASYTLPNAGFEPAVLGVASSSAEGVVRGPIEGNGGVFVLAVLASNSDTHGDETIEKHRISSGYGARATYEAYEALKKNAKIVDKRYNFY